MDSPEAYYPGSSHYEEYVLGQWDRDVLKAELQGEDSISVACEQLESVFNYIYQYLEPLQSSSLELLIDRARALDRTNHTHQEAYSQLHALFGFAEDIVGTAIDHRVKIPGLSAAEQEVIINEVAYLQEAIEYEPNNLIYDEWGCLYFRSSLVGYNDGEILVRVDPELVYAFDQLGIRLRDTYSHTLSKIVLNRNEITLLRGLLSLKPFLEDIDDLNSQVDEATTAVVQEEVDIEGSIEYLRKVEVKLRSFLKKPRKLRRAGLKVDEVRRWQEQVLSLQTMSEKRQLPGAA